MNWAQVADQHESELEQLQQRYDDLVLEKERVDTELKEAKHQTEEMEQLLMKSKLDGEYGYGPQTETPDHYARALKETAASRTKPGLRPTTVRRMPAERSETVDSTVDAKIVEDVLKEFLC